MSSFPREEVMSSIIYSVSEWEWLNFFFLLFVWLIDERTSAKENPTTKLICRSIVGHPSIHENRFSNIDFSSKREEKKTTRSTYCNLIDVIRYQILFFSCSSRFGLFFIFFGIKALVLFFIVSIKSSDKYPWLYWLISLIFMCHQRMIHHRERER